MSGLSAGRFVAIGLLPDFSFRTRSPPAVAGAAHIQETLAHGMTTCHARLDASRRPPTPERLYAQAMERRLVEVMSSAWPRRYQRFLEIGCGNGYFLQALWENGFDVTGVDASPTLLAAARDRMGNLADLHLGQADKLPFEDKEFDFTGLFMALDRTPDPMAVLREAARVTRKGVLITFRNRWSLEFLLCGAWTSGSETERWFGWLEMRSLIFRGIGCKPLRARSVLPGPACTWRKAQPWRFLNSRVLPPTIGAVGAVAVDLMGEAAMTANLLWKAAPGRSGL